MVQSTSPDAIAMWDNGDPTSIVQESQTQGASIQAALSKRERFDFVWANSSERTGQTGMVQGSRGYQVDTKSEYIYDNSAWRLALSHAEFTASVSIPNASGSLCGVFTLDPTTTTNSTFVVPGTTGVLIVADPGIYAVSTHTSIAAAATGRSFVNLGVGGPEAQRVSITVGEDIGSLAMPNVRTITTNVQLSFNIFQTTGATRNTTTRARITRMG